MTRYAARPFFSKGGDKVGPYYPAAELVRVLRATLPVHVTLPDPITGESFSIVRDDVLASLVVDTLHLHQEAQLVAAQYATFSRARRAAELAAERADFAYSKWKSGQSAQFRAGKVKTTVAETEDHYRSLPDYQQMATEGSRLRAIAGIMEDVQRAFSIKANIIRDQYQALLRSQSNLATEDRVPASFSPPQGPAPFVTQPPQPYVPKG